MEEQKSSWVCPLIKKKMYYDDCYLAALVYEGEMPLSELAEGMEYTEESTKICLSCKYHPE